MGVDATEAHQEGIAMTVQELLRHCFDWELAPGVPAADDVPTSHEEPSLPEAA